MRGSLSLSCVPLMHLSSAAARRKQRQQCQPALWGSDEGLWRDARLHECICANLTRLTIGCRLNAYVCVLESRWNRATLMWTEDPCSIATLSSLALAFFQGEMEGEVSKPTLVSWLKYRKNDTTFTVNQRLQWLLKPCMSACKTKEKTWEAWKIRGKWTPIRLWSDWKLPGLYRRCDSYQVYISTNISIQYLLFTKMLIYKLETFRI